MKADNTNLNFAEVVMAVLLSLKLAGVGKLSWVDVLFFPLVLGFVLGCLKLLLLRIDARYEARRKARGEVVG